MIYVIVKCFPVSRERIVYVVNFASICVITYMSIALDGNIRRYF